MPGVTVYGGKVRRYHVYRGVLNMEGQDLLKVFDMAIDGLNSICAMDIREAKKQKTQIRKKIESVG